MWELKKAINFSDKESQVQGKKKKKDKFNFLRFIFCVVIGKLRKTQKA